MVSGGKLLVDSLVSLGVRHVFCVPGESYLSALDGFYEVRNKVSVISCRHEGGASYMAEAYGKVSGMPGVCFVTRGPGASNAMVGVHTAYQDSTPMLLLVGQVKRAHRGREAFQELSYESVYGSVAKGVFRIDSASRLVEVLSRAWSLSLSGRPGPVVLELPEDMLKEEVEDGGVDILSPIISYPSPSVESMVRVAEVLRSVARPVMVVGGASWDAEASRLVESFSDTYGIPLITAFRRQDSVSNMHKNYIGELSAGAPSSSLDALSRSDCVIILSARFGDMTSCGYERLSVPYSDKKIVHVYPSGDELNRVYYAAAPVVSTASNFMSALFALEASGDLGLSEFWSAAELSALRGAYEAGVERPPYDTGDDLSMVFVSEHVRSVLSEGSIISAGAGNYTIWGQRHYQYSRFRTCLGCTNGSMGYGVPAAIAARVYDSESPIVCFSGDGCFMMTAQEIATAVQYGLAVIILVVNNSSYGTIRMHQEREYPGRGIATALRNPDFAAFARSFGAFGATVTRNEEFPQAFTEAQASGTVAVIDLKID